MSTFGAKFLPRKAIALMVAGGLCVAGSKAWGVAVDAELLLLVDTTQSVSDAEFGVLMNSVARSFETSGVISAIQSGTIGNLAVSLMFYTHRNQQVVGVNWMMISDANSAAAFAQSIDNLTRPLSQPRTGLAGALQAATPWFGDETGGVPNGFESSVQSIFFVGEGVDDHSQRTNGSRDVTVQNASQAALAAGVDMVSAVTVGSPGSVDAYFSQFVVGGQVGGTSGAVLGNASNTAQLSTMMQPTLQGLVTSIVPEPRWSLLALVAVMILGRRRRTS